MTFSWISTEREKQIVLRARHLMRVRRGRLLRSIRCVKILPVEGQVVTFNTLREDFAGQVFLLRLFSGVAAPVIAGHHAGTERSQQG